MRLLSATLPFPADALILKMIINVIVVCTYNRLKQKGHRFPANYAAVVQWFRVRPPATPGLVGSFHDDIWQRVSTWNRQSEWEETRNGNDDCYSAVNISSTSTPLRRVFFQRETPIILCFYYSSENNRIVGWFSTVLAGRRRISALNRFQWVATASRWIPAGCLECYRLFSLRHCVVDISAQWIARFPSQMFSKSRRFFCNLQFSVTPKCAIVLDDFRPLQSSSPHGDEQIVEDANSAWQCSASRNKRTSCVIEMFEQLHLR